MSPPNSEKKSFTGNSNKTQVWSDVLLAGTRDLAVNLPLRLFDFDFDLSDSIEELKKKIAWIIRIRFVVNPAVVVLMLLTNWQGLTKGADPLGRITIISTGLTALVSVALNLIYFLALHRKSLNNEKLRRFVFLQLMLDVLMFAMYLWRTGGVTSPFSFLFFLPIIASNILLGPKAGMGISGISAMCFVLVICLEALGTIPHISYFVAMDQFAERTSYVMLITIVNIFGFVVVGGTAGFFMRQVQAKARQLRKSNRQLEHKAGLFRMLYQVSEVLQHHQGVDEVVDRICDVLVCDLNVDRALMYVSEDNKLKLRRVTYHARVPESDRKSIRVEIPLALKEGMTARCAIENQAFNIIDPGSQEGINVELARQIGMNPFALAPMAYRERVLGVLGIDRSEQLGILSQNDFEVLILFARQAAQTLASAQAEERSPGDSRSAHSTANGRPSV